MNHKTQKGFSLIEIVVTLGVMAVLSAIVIGYSRQGGAQVKILKNKGEFVAELYRARALAIATYQYNPPECGYGIHIFTDEHPVRRYVLWRDTSSGTDCSDPSVNGVYDANGREDVEFFMLDPGIEFTNANAADFMSDILFIPPDPRIVRNANPGLTGLLHVTIGTADSSSKHTIGVNDYGQVEE